MTNRECIKILFEDVLKNWDILTEEKQIDFIIKFRKIQGE